MLQQELLSCHVKMATYEDKMNKTLQTIYKNLARNCEMLLHLSRDLLDLLLAVEFHILSYSLLEPVLGREELGFFHYRLLNGKLKESLNQLIQLSLQVVEEG